MRPDFFRLLLCFVVLAFGRSGVCDTGAFGGGLYLLRTDNSKGYFSVGAEATALSSSAGPSLSGVGPRAGADWDLGNSFSISPAVAFVTTTGGSYLYTGLSGFLRYTVSGNLVRRQQVLTREGVPVFEQASERSNRLTIGLGIEQLLLNGTQSIYSAAGPSVAISYSLRYREIPLEISGRFSALTASGSTLSGMFLNVSYLFGQ